MKFVVLFVFTLIIHVKTINISPEVAAVLQQAAAGTLVTTIPRDDPRVQAVLDSLQPAPRERTEEEQEQCELDRYAEGIVTLFIGRDRNGDHWRHRVDERLDELETFVEQIENMFMFATWGPNYLTNPGSSPSQLNYERRTKYLSLRIAERLMAIYFEACSGHYSWELSYRYSEDVDRFYFTNTLMIDSGTCLCQRDCDEHGGLPLIQYYRTPFFQINNNRVKPFVVLTLSTGPNGEKLVKHHIIPRKLIVAFLRTFLDSVNQIGNAYPHNPYFRDCTRIIFDRIKLTIQKILTYYIVKLHRNSDGSVRPTYDYRSMVFDKDFFDAVESLLTNSAGGNLFVGPENRGPLDPAFLAGADPQAQLEAFDYEAFRIIGEERHMEMFELFSLLLKYVREAPNYASSFERMSSGAALLVRLIATIERHRMTPYNPDDWVQRVLDDSEINRIKDPSERRNFRTQMFAAIKRKPRRDPRSLIGRLDGNECGSLKSFTRERWTYFIMDTFKLMLESRGFNESIVWSCNATRLYFQYRFLSTHRNFVNADCTDSNFDNWIYSRISNTPEWRDCINLKESAGSEKWCRALRRILFNSDVGNYWKNGTLTSKYYWDSQAVMHWLSKKLLNDGETKYLISKEATEKLYEVDRICYKMKNRTEFFCPACSSDSKDILSYESKWYKDTNEGVLKCQCSVDTSFKDECVRKSYLKRGAIFLEPCHDISEWDTSPESEDESTVFSWAWKTAWTSVDLMLSYIREMAKTQVTSDLK